MMWSSVAFPEEFERVLVCSVESSDLFRVNGSRNLKKTGLELFRGLFWLKLATMFKIIKEMLPPDVRVARDAQDLLVECCVGVILEEIHFLNNNNFTPYTLPGLLEWCTSENNRGSAVPRGILFTLVLKNAGSLSSPKADISVLQADQNP
ncbi:hypothetical protein Scep_022367 [Stephania cephalantha]|uniref:Transcription factor CBF/NF-Y/archaeal histone domain-containing protein n=1 Tax=Stephania cephalantha TaxID=152367 RepID=A0AAP0HXP8_9MAGN